MGHIGLTPQTAGALGGYKVQGRDAQSARRLLAEAKGLAEAGAFAIVLECIPDKLAAAITASVPIPTIGIGAGPQCDGQVLVINDLLGMFEKFVPSFVKQYANLAPQIAGAVVAFRDEVKGGVYPDAGHSFVMQGEVEDLLKQGKE
jgi:3-methyl-2-oxobutanoate hydroxymethyltransferase